MGHDRMAAENRVRAALFGAAVHNNDAGLTFVVDLVVDLRMRQHFNVNDVFDVHRPRRLREDYRRQKRNPTDEGENLRHKASFDCAERRAEYTMISKPEETMKLRE